MVAVGRNVDGFAVGDRVFGGSPGSFASYTAARADRVVHTPDDVSDEHAATVAIAGGTAYQAVVDIAKVGPGQSVLVTGASGGVGSYAVQIAKARGARVTAVCSTHNVEWVRDLGADHVIDYRKQDVTTITERFDAIIDNVATAPMRAMRRLLEPGGTYVVVGTVKKGRWIAAFLPLIRAKLVGMRGDKTMRGMLAESSPDTLNALGALLASGEVVPRIDRRFSLSEVPDAFRHQADGHAQGKSIIVP